VQDRLTYNYSYSYTKISLRKRNFRDEQRAREKRVARIEKGLGPNCCGFGVDKINNISGDVIIHKSNKIVGVVLTKTYLGTYR
jgi:hypothetical protein